ncbi:protein RecA-like isoform X4 [Zingiber officinale]|uniref:protein RecA-like isoform X4 n=1 Tax=Zingiber officinale TaxID=94328 RepID=UPI001C4CA62E|nr:protein RecA-like isoform X4 [Zingiber officinale]
MARLLLRASLRAALYASQKYGEGIPAPAFQYCNFSSKAKTKSKSDGSESGNFSSKAKRMSKSDGSESGKENLSKKDIALQQALDKITDSFGKGSIMWLGRAHAPREVPVVSTGSIALDMALGIGGLPKGCVVEIYGPEASGKTALALHVIAESQKNKGSCAFIDGEHALDSALVKSIGVKMDNLFLSQPDSGEQALSLIDNLIRSGSVDVVVVDSVSALVPKSEPDGEIGDAHMALRARLMSQALHKLTHSLSMSQTILLFINQVRAKQVASGGNALKFYASVRLNIRRIGFIKMGQETLGNQVSVKIVKNKHAPAFRTVRLGLEHGKGISREFELIDLGLKHKLITKGGGAMYSFNEQSFRGKDAIKHYLIKNDWAKEELATKLRQKILYNNDDDNKMDSQNDDDTNEEVSEELIMSDTTDEELIAANEEVSEELIMSDTNDEELIAALG